MAKKAARDSAPPSPSLGDRPLEQSLCIAPTHTGPPARGLDSLLYVLESI